MPAITDLKKEARKSIILNELANPNGEKDYKGIATKYKWDAGWVKDVLEDIQSDLEHVNTFNRAVLTIRSTPKAIDKLDTALTNDYGEPDHILRAGELGLRTLKAIDPKLRTQEVIQRHEGNVLLTIQSNFKNLLEEVEANYEVLPNPIEKIEPAPSQALIEPKQETAQLE